MSTVRFCLWPPFSTLKTSQASEIAHVFINVDSGGRQSGRHFSSPIHLHQAWCVLFAKSVPTDLRHHYLKPRIVQSLKTKSQAQARYASQKLLSRLDDYWLSLRLKEIEIPAAHLLRHVPSQNPGSVLPTIVDALKLYHRVKGENKKKTFFTLSKRSVDYLIQSIGCRSLDQYSSADAASFRDWLRDKGLSAGSIQRNFTSIKAMVSFRFSV